jgi:hypothetical protein
VRELLVRIDAAELAEWQAYWNINPWGERRADLRSGIVAATVANCLRGKNQKAHKVDEFMPDFEQQHRKFTDHLRGFIRNLKKDST